MYWLSSDLVIYTVLLHHHNFTLNNFITHIIYVNIIVHHGKFNNFNKKVLCKILGEKKYYSFCESGNWPRAMVNHLHFLAYLSMILNHLHVVYVTSVKWMYEYQGGSIVHSCTWSLCRYLPQSNVAIYYQVSNRAYIL
jgi:hypothetical protein